MLLNKKTIPLLNGIVIFPDDCVIVEQTKTAISNDACVIEEKNHTIPRFLVFSDTPFIDYTEADKIKLFERLGELYPEVKEVRKNEFEDVFGKNGTLVNLKEWDAAPSLGLFMIPEVDSMDKAHYGACIIRTEA